MDFAAKHEAGAPLFFFSESLLTLNIPDFCLLFCILIYFFSNR